MNYAYPKSLRVLIESYKKLPGIGEKSAERLALATLNMDTEVVNQFSGALNDVKTKIKKCQNCNNYSEDDLCDICKDQTRSHDVICIVADCKNVAAFEKTGAFLGTYHVLGGLISPLDGIGPEDIDLKSLFKRIESEEVKELILALNPSVEGETTTLYISKKMEGKKVKITKIAHGIPLGTDMDYIDSLTLEIALQGRTTIS
jgi:recombination protein RecR